MEDFVPAARTADLDEMKVNNPGGPGMPADGMSLDSLYSTPPATKSVVLDTGVAAGETAAAADAAATSSASLATTDESATVPAAAGSVPATPATAAVGEATAVAKQGK